MRSIIIKGVTGLFKRLNHKAIYQLKVRFETHVPKVFRQNRVLGGGGREGAPASKRRPRREKRVFAYETAHYGVCLSPSPSRGHGAPATVQLWAESQSMFTRTFLFEPPLNHAEWVLMTVFRPLIYLVTKSFHVPTVFWIIVEPGSYVRSPTAPISVNCFEGDLNGFECVWKKGNSVRCCSSSVLQTISSFFSWWIIFIFILQITIKYGQKPIQLYAGCEKRTKIVGPNYCIIYKSNKN